MGKGLSILAAYATAAQRIDAQFTSNESVNKNSKSALRFGDIALRSRQVGVQILWKLAFRCWFGRHDTGSALPACPYSQIWISASVKKKKISQYLSKCPRKCTKARFSSVRTFYAQIMRLICPSFDLSRKKDATKWPNETVLEAIQPRFVVFNIRFVKIHENSECLKNRQSALWFFFFLWKEKRRNI